MLYCKKLKDLSDEEDEVYIYIYVYIFYENEIVL